MDEEMRQEEKGLKPSKVLRAAADLLEKGWCQVYLGVRDTATHWITRRGWVSHSI